MSSQPRLVDDDPIHTARQIRCELGDRHPLRQDLTGAACRSARRRLTRHEWWRRRGRPVRRIELGQDCHAIDRGWREPRAEPSISGGDREHVQRQLSGLAVHAQPEPIFEQCLQHQIHRTDGTDRESAAAHRAAALATMSNRSEPIQPGASTIRESSVIPYAFRISTRSGTFVAVNRPPGSLLIITRGSPDRFGFTEATSNVRRASWGACAWTATNAIREDKCGSHEDHGCSLPASKVTVSLWTCPVTKRTAVVSV